MVVRTRQRLRGHILGRRPLVDNPQSHAQSSSKAAVKRRSRSVIDK
jgi:hypothetical protein